MSRSLMPPILALAVVAIPVAPTCAVPEAPPRDVLDAVERADEAYRAGRWGEARAAYEWLLARRGEPSQTLHAQIARCHSREGSHARAMEHFQAMIDADPGDEGLQRWIAQESFDLAALLLNTSKTEEAIPYLTRTIALDRAHVEARFRRGLAYLQLRRLAEARADLRAVVALFPASRQARMAREGLDRLP